jgi:hypothetical protein
MRFHAAALFCCLAPAFAQQLTFVEGVPGAMQITVVPEASPQSSPTILLQNVELMGIEITGRTLARELDGTRSRRTVRNGFERVELPGGGRLFQYRRNGGQFWGFLHVAADGTPRAVLERPGTGAQLESPFFDRIAVADDGQHAAIALVAGGLHVVRLDGASFASTGRPDRLAVPAAVEVLPASVMVGTTHAFCITSTDEVLRWPLADGGSPVDIAPPAIANGEFKDEMAMSRDGQHVVFLYGPRDLQRLYHATTSGPAVMLPPPPAKYEEPNYLPDGAGEPAMLLNDTGTRLFYIDADVRDELHLLDLVGALPDLQITENQIFQPYIGAHILPRFVASDLVVAIGDPGQMDWFKASLATAGGTVTNLTGTGAMVQPFPSGLLDPQQVADAGTAMLVTEQGPGGQVLRRLDPATGVSAIVQQGVLAAPDAGSSFSGQRDVLVRGASGDAIYRGSSGSLFAATPAGLLLTPPVHGAWLSATWLHLPSNWGIVVYYLADGTLLTGPIEFGVQQVVMTAAGGAAVVGSNVRYLGVGVQAVLNLPPAPVRVMLSGAGG